MLISMRHRPAALFLLMSLAHADTALPSPQRVIACSQSGAVCAESDPAANSTVIVRKTNTEVLWSIAGWHRWLFVADDGQSLAVAYDGMNLVPAESDLQLEVLRFYNQGKLVRSIKLADLYSNKSQLTRTASHFAWVRSIHVNRTHQLVLELVSGRSVAFVMNSGESLPETDDGA